VVNTLNIAQSAGAWTGTLDLADNNLIIHADALTRADVLNQTTNQIQSGRNSGSTPSTRWQGTGIQSSAAPLVASGTTGLAVVLNETSSGSGIPLHATFAAEDVDTNSILVKYSYTGDADVDGDVDADDYAQIDSGFASHLSGYRNGDFNYNGTIDADDFFLIDHAFSDQAAPLSLNEPALSFSPQTGASAAVTKNRQAESFPMIDASPSHKLRKSARHRFSLWRAFDPRRLGWELKTEKRNLYSRLYPKG